MRLYVISGVTGMTGNELARQILNAQDQVIGFDNFYASSIDTVSDLLDNKQFHFFEYDINNLKQMALLKDRVNGTSVDEIIYINCAAVVHTEHFYHIHDTFNTNVTGMKSFLDQAISVGASTFINCSTSEVYSMNSWNDEGGVREDDYLTLAHCEHSQRTSYAVGKLLTEFFMKDAVDTKSILGCSVRFANVYSENELYPKHIIPHILASLKNSGEVVLLDNSRRNKRTFLHNTDSCNAVLALINTKKSLNGSVYNVATDEEISIVDLVALCAKTLGVDNYRILYKGHRQSDPERRMLNTEKIRMHTKWRPEITLEVGIQMCVDYMKG